MTINDTITGFASTAHNQATDQALAVSGTPSATGGMGPQLSAAATGVPVSIVSHSLLLRDGLVALLAPHIDLLLIGSYAPEPPSILLPNPPGHVVLLDGGIGRAGAIGWTRYWRHLTPPAHVLVLELANDTDVILACIEAGAGGYTLQGASAAEVASAIHAVRQDLAQCPPEVTAKLFARLAALGGPKLQPPSLRPHLTAREREVLHYLAQDYSNQEIATVLSIEVRTVKHHVHNILEKLQINRRRDAARVAVEQGWLETRPPALLRRG